MDNDFTHRPGFLTGLALALMGGNAARAARAGRDDQGRFGLLAVALVLLMAWIGFNAALALVIATGADPLAPTTLAFAGLVAGMYGVIDLALVQARWWTMGRDLARERGFGLTRSRGAAFIERFSAVPFGMIRAALALAMAVFSAMTFSLWYWQSDIADRLAADNIRANAELQARIESEIDRDIAATTTELEQIAARIAARAARAEEAASATQSGALTRRATLDARKADLDQRIAALDDAIACAERTARAEAEGLTTCEGRLVTNPGTGPLHAAALAEQSLLEGEKARLVTERTAVEAELAALPAKPPAVVPDPEAARHDALVAERARLLSERAGAVRQRMQADQAFVVPADGLSIRQKALAALMDEEPSVKLQVFVVKALFFLLDLSLIAITFGRSAASVYALMQAVEFETRSAAIIADGRAVVAAAEAKGAEAEVRTLQARLATARAEQALRTELRRIALGEAMLDRWSDGITGGDPPETPPRFDA